jgi:hypothetical protein
MTQSTEQLVTSFEELYLIEKKAHDLYEQKLTEELTQHERNIIQSIHDDEERHMQIVTDIIKIIKKEKHE